MTVETGPLRRFPLSNFSATSDSRTQTSPSDFGAAIPLRAALATASGPVCDTNAFANFAFGIRTLTRSS